MLLANGNPYQYDNSGNLVSTQQGKSQFVYNGGNKLEKAINTIYEYDGDGLLISRNKNNQKTTFINNPLTDIWQPLAAISDDNSETFYIWEGDNPVAAIENGEATFFLTDHLSSVRGLVDAKGKLTQQLDYSPFGVPDQELSNVNFMPGFTGLFYEPDAKLYLTKARAYDPNIGRFLQIDPLHQTPSGSQKVFSVFAYCGSDPVNFLDHCGRQTKHFDNWPVVNFFDRDGLQSGYNSFQQIYNPLEVMYQMDRFSKGVIDHSSYGNVFNKPYPFGNNRIRNELFTSAPHDLLNYINPIHSSYDHVKFDFAESAIDLGIRDLGIKNLFPRKISSNVLNYSHSAYSIIREIPRFNQLSISDKIDVFGNFTSFSSSPFSAMITPVIKAYWGMTLNYLNYNPADRFMLRYGNTKITYDPTTNRTTRTSSIKYREVTTGGVKRIIPESNFRRRDLYPGSGSGVVFGGGGGPGPGGGGGPGPGGGGGPGRGPGPGGGGGPGGSFFGGFHPMMPSNVGGVYLGGAGKAFEGLGQLNGIAIDESNGKLVLISEDQGTIDLPPLRLDDVVTVFQSVYQQGEAPFVSIDPDSLNPKGPVMNTRHGEATNDTYVGWVLFETDRIMKAYSLGEDNISKEPVQNNIVGYAEVLETMFSGNNRGNNWERFWIVPDRKEKSMSDENSITLFDVPLRVNTQKVVLRNGKLEPDLIGSSSKGAEAFSTWFTENYDKIADESYSLPPAGSGFTTPVPVFKELERIALITAIAEQLRDQGIVYPFWMRGYEINKFQIPKTTPSHTVTRKNGNMILSVFGGVNLSASDDRVFTIALSPSENKLAEKLESILIDQPYFESVSLKVDESQYQVAILPGNDTKDLGVCRLIETDLSVPMECKYSISLSRIFNSFIDASDKIFGNTWTLDLPFLEEQGHHLLQKRHLSHCLDINLFCGNCFQELFFLLLLLLLLYI